MAERRKDSKNRVLRSGESQRKDGTYMYRYTDVRGKRHPGGSSGQGADDPEGAQRRDRLRRRGDHRP